jgi:hypothetical protein
VPFGLPLANLDAARQDRKLACEYLLVLEPIREPPAERGTVPFCSENYAKGDSPRRFSDRL